MKRIKNILEKLTVALALACTPLVHADSVDINNTKSVVVTGYGVDHDQALKNAFQSAVEQQIGVLIDSETIIANDKVIKDEILTASNGYIEKYTELSSSVVNGLTQVKIKAKIKSQKIEKEIISLNISSLTIKDQSNTYAKIITKEKSKKDNNKILENAILSITSKKTYHDMLEFRLTKHEVLEDKSSSDETSIKITFEASINEKLYNQKISELEKTLKNIGSKNQIIDYITVRKNKINGSISNLALKNEEIVTVKKMGRKYSVHKWILPKNINFEQTKEQTTNWYSTSRPRKPHRDVSTLNIEVIDNKNNILGGRVFDLFIPSYYPCIPWGEKRYKRGSISNSIGFCPFIPGEYGKNYQSDFVTVEKLELSTIIKIYTDDLKDLSKIVINKL